MTTKAVKILGELEAQGTAQNRKIYARHGVGEAMFGVSYATGGSRLHREDVGSQGATLRPEAEEEAIGRQSSSGPQARDRMRSAIRMAASNKAPIRLGQATGKAPKTLPAAG